MSELSVQLILPKAFQKTSTSSMTCHEESPTYINHKLTKKTEVAYFGTAGPPSSPLKNIRRSCNVPKQQSAHNEKTNTLNPKLPACTTNAPCSCEVPLML